MSTDRSRENIPRAFMDAWNRHDARELAALFAEDASFVNVVGTWWKNRAEIEAAHAAVHATIFKHSRLEGEIGATTDLGTGMAALHVLWQLSGMSGPDGKPAAPRHGILLFIVAQDAKGGWLIVVAQNTDIVEGAIVPEQVDIARS